MTPTPPYAVVRDLAAYDSTVRLRWGPETQLWYLEKKMDARHPSLMRERPNPIGTSPRARDLWEGWKNGYAVVMCVHPSLCNSRTILAALNNADIHAADGPAALNRRLDAIQAAEDKAKDRDLDTFVEATTRELYDRDQWLGKRKIQVPNEDAAVERITPLVQHEGFHVLDRRIAVTHGE